MRASGGAYRLGRFTLEPRRQLLDSGRPVALGGKALDLLSVLAEAKGDLVTKDELMAAVWPGIIVEENAIQVHISAARKALGDEAGRLVTVRGKGYRLEVGDRSPAPRPRPSRRLAIVAAVALGAAAIWLVTEGRESPSEAAGGATSTPEKHEADRLHASAVKLFRERTRPGYSEAEKLLRRAIAADPHHAPSWSRLAMAVYAPSWWAEQAHPGAQARLYSEALGYARRALAIDPQLAEAHQAVGFILFDRDPLPWLERAAALDPNDPEIADQLARALTARLEMRRALTESARAFALDPTNARFADNYAYLLRRLGRRAEAYRLIDMLEHTTTRAAQARQIRFRFAYGEGRLTDASAQAARAIAVGDEDRWWPREAIYQSAVILGETEVAARMLRMDRRMAVTVCYYQDASRALRLARTAPNEWWDDIMPGALARQIVAAGRSDLLLALYDARYTSVEAFWADNHEHDDSLAPPLVLAMRAAGRESEAAELRNRFAADIDKLTAEGDASLRVPLGRAYLAALDGRGDAAAAWFDKAVAAGWKTQDAGLGLAPDRDPVFAAVRADVRFQAAIGHFRAAVAVEAARFRKLDLPRRPWMSLRT